jgi:hypothetical protein
MTHYNFIISYAVIIGKILPIYFVNYSGCYIHGLNGIKIGDN